VYVVGRAEADDGNSGLGGRWAGWVNACHLFQIP
jgi:hypothetical protein